MLFNDLPDELLFYIFDDVFDMKQLIEMSKVCSRWHQLILHRFNKVTYIPSKHDFFESKRGKVLMNHSDELKGLNLNFWFPNLKIVDFSVDEIVNQNRYCISHGMKFDEVEKIIHNTPSIKGAMIKRLPVKPKHEFVERFADIEMVMINSVAHRAERYFNPDILTQLHAGHCYFKDLSRIARSFINLTRLHVMVETRTHYAGPKFRKLKILEFTSCWSSNEAVYPGYIFMDYCPSLEAAYFEIRTTNYSNCINESVKNYNLKSLVISHVLLVPQVWPTIKRLLIKFPNLENLAFRENNKISDAHVPELIELLPKLKVLDFRPDSPRITRKSSDYLAKYCQKSGRSIVIYLRLKDEHEPSDWPKIDETLTIVCNGFDFVQHCFYRNFYHLPFLMDT